MTEDTHLLRLWQSGDAAAGNRLFARHLPIVRKFVKRFNVDVDDITQDALVAFLEGAARFRGDADLGTFILAIARHKSLSARRRTERRSAYASLMPMGGREDGDEPANEYTEMQVAVAMRSLSPEAKALVQLVYWEGVNRQEAARRLGVCLGTLASRLRLAKMVLRRALSAPDETQRHADSCTGE